jgi:hypothetical protein
MYDSEVSTAAQTPIHGIKLWIMRAVACERTSLLGQAFRRCEA